MSLATGIRQSEQQDYQVILAPKADKLPSHPLANSKLGKLKGHYVFNGALKGEAADWQTCFNYEKGEVILSVRQNQYNYKTEEY